MSLKGSTSHGPALLKPISLADIRKLASAVNLIFARDPGTAYGPYLLTECSRLRCKRESIEC